MKLLPLFFFLCAPAFGAEFYQCKDENGRAIFSQTPCSKDAKKQFVNEPNRKSEVALKRLANEKRKDEITKKLIPQRYIYIMSLREERDTALNQLGADDSNRQVILAQYEEKVGHARHQVKQLEVERDRL